MSIGSFESEVLGQAAALRDLVKVYAAPDTPLRLLDPVLKSGKTPVPVFIGMGTSLFAPESAVCWLAARGLPARTVDAGEYLHYLAGSLERDALPVLVSQSGESAEMLRLAGNLGRPYVAVTNTPGSTLARNAQAVLPMVGGVEKSTTNRTFTNSIAASLLIAYRIAGADGKQLLPALGTVADGMEKLLDGWRKWMEPAALFTGVPAHFDIMGRGPSLSTVRQAGLILRELAHLKGGWFTTGTFRHGLVPSMKKGGVIIVLAPSGRTFDLNRGLVDDVLAQGGKAVLITDRDAAAAPNLHVLRLPEVDEFLAPMLSIIPLEMYGILMAESQGMDPGADIAKVTTKE